MPQCVQNLKGGMARLKYENEQLKKLVASLEAENQALQKAAAQGNPYKENQSASYEEVKGA